MLELNCERTLLIFVALFAACGLVSRTSAGQINFDDVPNNTVIDTHYPGVTFGCVACGSGHAYARDMNAFGGTTAASEPNVVTLLGPPGSSDTNASSLTSFNAKYGAVTVFFATPQRTVSIQTRPQMPLEFFGQGLNKPYLEAYSSTTQNAATFLGRVLYPLNYGTGGWCQPDAGACSGPWQTLTFTSGSDNIVSLRLSSQQSQGGPNVFADFDNLVFETSAPPPITPQPEASFCADFNSGIPSGMTLFGTATANSGFLKLTDNTQGQFGVAYINDFNGGRKVTSFQATFKAMLFGTICCNGIPMPADGFSFNLVPAASTPATPDLNQPWEEGPGQGLTVSFDSWDNLDGGGEAPAIDVKWQGQVIAHAPFQPSQSPSGAQTAAAASRNVVINLDEDGTIDVSYGGVLVINNVQTPYSPTIIGTPKWIMGARTGFSTDNHWFDDLCITARSGGSFCADFNAGNPAGFSLFGDATVNGGKLKLITLPANLGYGIAYIDDFGRSDMVQAFKATFKAALFGSTCCGGGSFPADGFSFNLVPASSAKANPGYGEPAEEGSTDGLSVTFDTWDNGGGEAPAVEIKWLGDIIASVPFQASQSPAGISDPNLASRDVMIELTATGVMNVSYGGSVLLANVNVPYDAAVIGTPKWVLGGRIGGANDNFWFDDFCITTLSGNRVAIPGLFNTGVDASRASLPNDARDPHYKLTLGGTDAFVETSAPGFPVPPWLPDSPVSAWIAPSLDTSGPSDGSGVGNYKYETTFVLTGFNPATARLTGRWATDNSGVDILINGVSTGQANTGGFDRWTGFRINSGFVAGTNRLTFIVQNGLVGSPAGNDPTGLRAEVWGSAALDTAFSRPQPHLTITRQGGNVLASWSGSGFVLEGAASVFGPWLNLSRGVSSNDQDFSATVSATGQARFLRLRLDLP
jgi:hypothetical protein